MEGVARSTEDDRQALFRVTAEALGITELIVEKDFWVCWSLSQLFSLEGLPALLFKGGTSLSKGYQLIERFSEDVDLSLNRADLGFGGDQDPIRIDGTKARRRRLDELQRASAEVIANDIVPALRRRFEERLGSTRWTLELNVEDRRGEEVLFLYPRSLGDAIYEPASYLPHRVKMEFGARSDHEPQRDVPIRPYAAEVRPEAFSVPAHEIPVLAPERTFWEKAVALHGEINWSEANPTTARPRWRRFSRHVYDLFMLKRKAVAERAIGQVPLLDAVRSNTLRMFQAPGTEKSEEARPGSFRLMPGGKLKSALKEDYERMQEMIFGERPGFDEILDTLQGLESRINA